MDNKILRGLYLVISLLFFQTGLAAQTWHKTSIPPSALHKPAKHPVILHKNIRPPKILHPHPHLQPRVLPKNPRAVRRW